MPLELTPGQMLGAKYRLERLVGQGGMGAVWQATNTVTQSAVALKFLKVDDGRPLSHSRFLREARAAGAVRHENVRKVFDVVEREDGSPVLVMEYLEGSSLADRLASGARLTLTDTAAVVVQVASAVGTAHAAGLIHRDLKPHNIFLVDGGLSSVKVLDFGIAKFRTGHDATESAETASGAILGTPNYMSPEQVFGERDIDHRTDIWSLGLVMYECLSGVLPTRAANVGQVMKIIVAEPIVDITHHVPELPGPVVDLLRRMLARSPERRPVSLSEVMGVLRAHTMVRAPDFGPPAERRPTDDPAAGDGIDASAPDLLGGQATLVSGEQPPLRVRRYRGMAVAAAAVAVLSLAAFVASGGRPEPSSAQSADAHDEALAGVPSRADVQPTLIETSPAETARVHATSAAKPRVSAASSMSSRVLAAAPPSARPAASAAPSAFSPSQRFE